jgi:hypothetical protein
MKKPGTELQSNTQKVIDRFLLSYERPLTVNSRSGFEDASLIGHKVGF